MKFFASSLAIALIVALPATAKDQLSINGSFQRVNTSSNATNVPGVVFDMAIGNGKARVTLTCTNVAPNTNFQFIVGTVSQATFAGNVRRRANLFFQNFPGRYTQPLEFDPRDQVLTIFDGRTNLLKLTVGTANQSTNLSYHETVDLAALGGRGSAEASYDQTKADLRTFKVKVNGVSAGTYDVFVDGLFRGSIAVAKGTKGSILFKYPYGNNDLPLTFDPRGKLVQVQRQAAAQFTGILRTPLPISPGP